MNKIYGARGGVGQGRRETRVLLLEMCVCVCTHHAEYSDVSMLYCLDISIFRYFETVKFDISTFSYFDVIRCCFIRFGKMRYSKYEFDLMIR